MDTNTIILIAVAVIILLWIISTNNWFRRTEVQIDEAAGDLDASLQRRLDQVTEVMESVHDAVDDEIRGYLEIARSRSGHSGSDLSELNANINQCIKSLAAVAEDYPELKGSERYSELNKVISETEEDIQASRRIFNNNVSIFNQKLVSFPSCLVGRTMLHMEKKEFFKADEEAKHRVSVARKKAQ